MFDTLCANTQVKHLVLNCHDQGAFAIFESSTECEILAKGSEVPFGGVKVFGKNYKYVQLRIKAETILVLKVISNLIPFAREYIQSLLFRNNQGNRSLKLLLVSRRTEGVNFYKETQVRKPNPEVQVLMIQRNSFDSLRPKLTKVQCF